MSKSRRQADPRQGAAATNFIKEKLAQKKRDSMSPKAMRETVESIVLAVILAFLFRAFEAEAFVIPTGSMAPTLQGRHIDVECEQCGHWYRSGASEENEDRLSGYVVKTTCPICRFPMSLDRAQEINPDNFGKRNPNHDSFNGDRIIVSKFAYEFADPERWDVIVFKYPGNPKQAYIKRLVGLPGETVVIRHGDIYVKNDDGELEIQRKPPYKLKSMLQLVDDTNFIGQQLIDAKWPSRWQQWATPEQQRTWTAELTANAASYETDGSGEDVQWLRYRHLVPGFTFEKVYDDDGRVLGEKLVSDWSYLSRGQLPQSATEESGGPASGDDPLGQPKDIRRRKGQLITDFYAYNHKELNPPSQTPLATLGWHWVGDLCVVAEVDVKGDEGRLFLDLVEGGVHYTCRIDVADGTADLLIDDEVLASSETKVRGGDSYQFRFANVDDELRLWIDDRLVSFDASTEYPPAKNVTPRYNGEDDPGDAEPVGIGSDGVELKVTRLQVLRDIYYVAQSFEGLREMEDDLGRSLLMEYVPPHDYESLPSLDVIHKTLTRPESWNQRDAFFNSRRSAPFTMGEDQFFPLGDNSPSSKDGRAWTTGGENPTPRPYFDRKYLTGKALFIYWPHSWRSPVPLFPNFKRMGFIR